MSSRCASRHGEPGSRVIHRRFARCCLLEFIAISTGGDVSDLEKTVTNSRAFKEAGGKLVSLSFPETRAQRFGETVILYGSYDAVIFNDGKEQPMRGRLTEIFVKRDGRWVHPGWHLDAR